MKGLKEFIAENASDINAVSKKIIDDYIIDAESILDDFDPSHFAYRAIRMQFLFAAAKKTPKVFADDVLARYSSIRKFAETFGEEEARKLCGRIATAQKKQNDKAGWRRLFTARFMEKRWGNQDVPENRALEQVFDNCFKNDFIEGWCKSLKYDAASERIICASQYDLKEVYVEKGVSKTSEYISVSNSASVTSMTTEYTVYIDGKEYATSIYKSLGAHRV